MTRALIIGAGPGGLTTAIALRTGGIDAAVFERASVQGTGGSGLTLWPNAMQALDRIGCAGAVGAICLPFQGIAIRSWRGHLLSATPGGEVAHLAGGIGTALLRAELMAVLGAEAGEDVLNLGCPCTGFHTDGRGVTAHFADGREEWGDLLIGADGLHSRIACQVVGAHKLRYAGYCVWRGVANFKLTPAWGVTSMGPGAQFGLFPMRGDRTYWFAAQYLAEQTVRQIQSHRRALLDWFGDWHDPIPAVIERTADQAIVATNIYDRNSLPRWGVGRVTLVGDAAHPSEPTLGQGACQAIEDAIVLSACLQDHAYVPAALQAYEAQRRARATAIARQARWMGRMGRWRWRPLCWFRECMIRATPAPMSRRHLQWLFQFPH